MPTDREPHPAVAALLSVTAKDGYGEVVCEYDADSAPLSGCSAELVAARQAVAMYRMLASLAPNKPEARRHTKEADYIKCQYRTEGDE